MSLFGKFKSAAFEQGVKMLLAPHLEGIGLLRDIAIDTDARTVRVELELNGEQTVVTVKAGYEFHDEPDNGLSVSLKSFEGSRTWMNGVFERFGKGRRFRLPDEHAGKIRLAMG